MKFFLILFLFLQISFADKYSALLFNGNCITCHDEKKPLSAPSVKIIKKRYLEAFPQKQKFVSFMSKWVLKPKRETSIMHDMIEKYELMPELGYDIDTLEKISAYIYDTTF